MRRVAPVLLISLGCVASVGGLSCLTQADPHPGPESTSTAPGLPTTHQNQAISEGAPTCRPVFANGLDAGITGWDCAPDPGCGAYCLESPNRSFLDDPPPEEGLNISEVDLQQLLPGGN